jgi:hypothetical protein
VQVLEWNKDTDWALIRCAWDGYEGWCKHGQLHELSFKRYKKETGTISITHDGALRLSAGTMWLPAGSELDNMKRTSELEHGVKFKGKKKQLEGLVYSPDALLEATRSYMYAPYQWGGRSKAGIDCSGLVQMAFKLCGIPVARDAADQVALGEEVHFLPEARKGDIAFFDNPEGRIVHVGIIDDNQSIIHATDVAGRVVEDRIDGGGIISLSHKKRTHTLRAIRRIIR